MRPSTALRLALVVALVVSTTTSASNAAGELTASSLRGEGQGSVNAGFAALYRLDRTQSDLPPDASFQLDGREVRVVTYESDPAVTAGDVGYVPVTPDYEPRQATYQDARVTSQDQTRSEFKFGLVAGAGSVPPIKLSSGCSTLAPPDRSEFEVPWLIQAPSQPVKTDVSNAALYGECGSSTAEVEGDFTVVLFQVDAILETGSEAVELRSGYDKSSTLPGATADATEGFASHMSQQYLYVTGGRITFKLDDAPHLLYLRDPSLDFDGTLAFADAAGQLQLGSSPQGIDAQSLTLAGTVHLDATAANGLLRSTMQGQVTEAEADGQPLSLGAAPASSASWLWWSVTVAVLVTAAAAAGRFYAPGPRARRLIVHASQLASSEGPRTIALCTQALHLKDDLGVAYFVRARALTEQGQLEAARADCRRAWDLTDDAELRATVALQAYVVCQHLRLTAERDAWLARARA